MQKTIAFRLFHFYYRKSWDYQCHVVDFHSWNLSMNSPFPLPLQPFGLKIVLEPSLQKCRQPHLLKSLTSSIFPPNSTNPFLLSLLPASPIPTSGKSLFRFLFPFAVLVLAINLRNSHLIGHLLCGFYKFFMIFGKKDASLW